MKIVYKLKDRFEFALPTHGVMTFGNEASLLTFLSSKNITNYTIIDGNPRAIN